MPVYFIQAGEDGPIKIGFARDVGRRIANMRVANPAPLKLRANIPGDARDERAFHARFANLRVRGEWFRPSDELLCFIAAMPAPDSASKRRGRPSHLVGTPLSDWMAANGIDDDALAAALEIDRSTVSRFRRGKHRPSAKTIEKIAVLTNGAVQPNSFFGLPPAEMAAA